MTTAAQLGEAYAIEGPAIELGSVVIDGTAYPEARVRMPLSMLNRHGLVAGATGTGKTKTLQGEDARQPARPAARSVGRCSVRRRGVVVVDEGRDRDVAGTTPGRHTAFVRSGRGRLGSAAP